LLDADRAQRVDVIQCKHGRGVSEFVACKCERADSVHKCRAAPSEQVPERFGNRRFRFCGQIEGLVEVDVADAIIRRVDDKKSAAGLVRGGSGIPRENTIEPQA